MQAIEVIRSALQFTDGFAQQFFEDMRDAPLTQPTPRGGNHPLWVMGHLACSEGGITGMIRGDANPLAHWMQRFGPGSEPTADSEAYPPFDEVFDAYRAARSRTLSLLESVGDAGLDAAPQTAPPQMREMFQTNADVFMLIPIHQEFHMGQVADARRALGRKPLMRMADPAPSPAG